LAWLKKREQENEKGDGGADGAEGDEQGARCNPYITGVGKRMGKLQLEAAGGRRPY
jgi:hypothetical protein